MGNIKQKATTYLPPKIREDILWGLFEHGKIKVVGLGIFEMREIPARDGRNPKTGLIVTIGPYKKIKFRPTSVLKRAVCRFA